MTLLRNFEVYCLGFGVCTAVLGCVGQTAPSSSGDAAVTASTCDPLARREMTLVNVLGVGKDTQGTYYVADEPSGSYEPRVFVSLDGTLFVRHVSGSGGNGSGETLSYDDADSLGIPEQALLLDVVDGHATAMALAPYLTRYFIGDVGASYDSLELADAADVALMKIMSLPHRVNYLGSIFRIHDARDRASRWLGRRGSCFLRLEGRHERV